MIVREYAAGLVIVCALFGTGLFAQTDEHIRLRVVGKNIITSPLADPPNQVFCPVGTAAYITDIERPGFMEEFAWFMKAHSLNTVRLCFNATTYKLDYDFDTTLVKIHRWLDIARENRIYTIFDNHEYLGHRNVSYTSEAMFDLWKGNFRKLAEQTKDNPWVMGYEIMNEIYTAVMTAEQIQTRLRECAHEIRSVGATNIIFLPLYNIDPSNYDVLDPPQIVGCPHPYPTSGGSGRTPIEGFDEKRTLNTMPILISEFGAGTMANGYTYAHNKRWLRECLDALDDFQMGWMIWYYRPGYGGNNASSAVGDWFGTLYGPDDPDIWWPAAKTKFEKYPIANNGVAAGIEFDEIAAWFPGKTGTNEDVELTLRIVDTTGSMVTGSNAAVSLSVSGPATLSGIPSNFSDGKAVVTLQSGSSAGTIVVTASSGGISGSTTITSAQTWSGFQIQKVDDSWINEGEISDDQSPACRVNIQHPSKGISLLTARYEYSTDGGVTWVYWDPQQSDEFDGTSLNTSKWTAENHNSSNGSAAVSNGALTITAQGENVWSTWTDDWWVANTYAKDEFYYVHEERTGEFEIVTKINSQQNTSPTALAGILVRDGMEDTRFNGMCYVAATPDSGFVFAWKDLGILNNGGTKADFKYIDSRVFAGNVTYPCYVKLTKVTHPGNYEGSETGYNRQYQIYTGWYSTDGLNWTKIKSRWVAQAAQTQRVGLFACPVSTSATGTAVFDFYRVHLTAARVGEPVSARYSSGVEQFETGDMPFVNTTLRQEVRFRINTVPPCRDFMNNPGEELVSPRFTVFDGEFTGIRSTEKLISDAQFNVRSHNGSIHLAYTPPSQELFADVRFSMYDIAGRRVWAGRVAQPQHAGTMVWQGSHGSGVSAGAYVVRMEARAAGTQTVRTIQTSLIHPGL